MLGSIYHFRVKAVNTYGTTYGDDMTFIATYSIGENNFGGIIFYLDETGQHGLVFAPTDQSSGALWGCMSRDLPGAGGMTLGTGTQNTIDIINGCSEAWIAARICYDLELNNYSDWFLPSNAELGLMYTNLKTKGYGGFGNGTYWSSSEVSFASAFYWRFSDGYGYIMFKDNSNRVRAVRMF